jgi:hypothetical protein
VGWLAQPGPPHTITNIIAVSNNNERLEYDIRYVAHGERRFSMWYRLRVVSITLSLILLLFYLLPLPVSAAEGPCRYYGELLVNGAHPTSPKMVTAWIMGVQYAQAMSGPGGQEPWKYLIDVPFDNPVTPAIEGGKTGDIVLFKIDGVDATPTGIWYMGQYVLLNLSVQITPTRLEGDVNGDGVIDPADALMVGQHIVKIRTLTGDDFLAADVNDDGVVDPADRLYIRQYIVHIRDAFPGGIYIP